jgi:peptide/nickel transport system substrate-binding protein
MNYLPPPASRAPRLTRRAFVASAVAVASGARLAPPAAAASDTLVWDIAAGPQYVDPVMGTAAQANVMVVQNVYERLVWYDGPGTEPVPWLATGWEVHDDGRRYVFKLRQGI